MMNIGSRATGITLRFDSEESILDALDELCRHGIDLSEAAGQLVRTAPTDLDLLGEILARLRENMADNDAHPPLFEPLVGDAPKSRRYGRFAV